MRSEKQTHVSLQANIIMATGSPMLHSKGCDSKGGVTVKAGNKRAALGLL